MRRLLLAVVTTGSLLGLVAGARLTAPLAQPRLKDSASLGAVQPRNSPDGHTIEVSHQGAIWTVPRVGGALTRLTHDTGFDIEPTWSPDGEHIAYVNSPRFGSGELRIVGTEPGRSACQVFSDTGSASILAARMKSFSDRPPIACV